MTTLLGALAISLLAQPYTRLAALSCILSMDGFRIKDLGAPTATTDAITKDYADAQDMLWVSKSGDNMTGVLDMHNNRIQHFPLHPVDTSDACTATFMIQEDLNLQATVVLYNGTEAMTGDLNMDTHYINNMADLTNLQYSETKAYIV